jgi:hypothetical protein
MLLPLPLPPPPAQLSGRLAAFQRAHIRAFCYTALSVPLFLSSSFLPASPSSRKS